MDDTRIRADSQRKRRLLLSKTSNDGSQNDVGRRSPEGTRCKYCRLQWSLLPITPEPRRNGEQGLDRASPRGRIGTKLHLGSLVSIPWSQGSTESLGYVQRERSYEFKQSRYDGCLFYRFEPSREHVEEKAGRHIDDFLVTGPEPNVERFLAQARDKLNMRDAVRLYKTVDEGRLLAMNLRKLENRYSLQGKPFLIHGIATALGMENAKTSLIPASISEKPQR